MHADAETAAFWPVQADTSTTIVLWPRASSRGLPIAAIKAAMLCKLRVQRAQVVADADARVVAAYGKHTHVTHRWS